MTQYTPDVWQVIVVHHDIALDRFTVLWTILALLALIWLVWLLLLCTLAITGYNVGFLVQCAGFRAIQKWLVTLRCWQYPKTMPTSPATNNNTCSDSFANSCLQFTCILRLEAVWLCSQVDTSFVMNSDSCKLMEDFCSVANVICCCCKSNLT